MDATEGDRRYSIYRLSGTGTFRVTICPVGGASFGLRLRFPHWLESHPPEIEPDITNLMYLAHSLMADSLAEVGAWVPEVYEGDMQLMCHRFAVEVIAPIEPGRWRRLTSSDVRDWVAGYVVGRGTSVVSQPI